MSDNLLSSKMQDLETGLPGFNIKEALDCLGGNPDMYLMFLFRFHERYAGRGTVLEEYLKKGDLFEAHRFVHSIKSLAGNLGAVQLREQAVALEGSMQRGRQAPSEEKVELFLDELDRIISLIGEFLESNEDD